jgi:5-methylcytosine-specific restriction endonuclease McrA
VLVLAGLAWVALLTWLLGPLGFFGSAILVVPLAWHRFRQRFRPGALRRGPRLFTTAMRREILSRDGARCAYCPAVVHFAADCPNGRLGCDDDYQCDHYVAWDDGGDTAKRNGVTACRWCNQHKGAMSIEEFREWAYSPAGRQAWADRVMRRRV